MSSRWRKCERGDLAAQGEMVKDGPAGMFVSIARPFSSTERSRLPRGFSARRAMFVRCANGREYDLELTSVSKVTWIEPTVRVLDKVEHGHPVTDR